MAPLALAACEGGPTHTRVPGFSIELQATPPDTALSVLPGGLFVQLRGQDLAPIPGAAVSFDVLMDSASFQPSLFVTRDTIHYNWGRSARDTTGADGRAWTGVRLGCRAGAGRVRIRVPSESVDTTLAFAITPGAAVGVRIAPADTTIMAGQSAQLRGGVVDQCFNRRPEPISVTAGPFALADTTLAVQGTAAGRTYVVVRGAMDSDSALVTVLPAAVLVVRPATSNSIRQVNLDGTGRTDTYLNYFPSYPPAAFAWGPAATVAFQASDSAVSGQALFQFQGAGKPVKVPAIAPAIAYDRMTPRYSPDGNWIYYAQGNYNFGNGSMAIWRVHPDGTAAAELVPNSNGSRDMWPAPSPDGLSVVFQSTRNGTLSLWKTVVGTGAASLFHAGCGNPAWSPDGKYIACVDPTPNLLVLTAAGSLTATLSMAGAFGAQTPCWTPDSKWLMYGGNTGLHLVNPVSRDTLGLGGSTAFWSDCALRALP